MPRLHILSLVAVCAGVALATPAASAPPDHLVDPAPFVAEASRSDDGRELILDNGLLRRTWRLAPNGACVGYDNLVTGESMLRSVRPEARVTIDGVAHDVGGLVGQPNHAFLLPEWLDAMTVDPSAMRLVDVEIGEPAERLAWNRRRHAAPDATWPPKGVAVRFDFELPPVDATVLETAVGRELAVSDGETPVPAPASDAGRDLLYATDFTALDDWTVHAGDAHGPSSFENEGKPGEIAATGNTAVYAERPLPPGARVVEATIDVGTDRSKSWGPGLALVWPDRVVKFNIRPVGNSYDTHAVLGLWNGERENARFGGRMKMELDRPWALRFRRVGDRLLCDTRPEGGDWMNRGVVDLPAGLGDPTAIRVGKMDVAGGGSSHADPGTPGRLRVRRVACFGELDAARLAEVRRRLEDDRQVRVSVHYEMYDGIPAMSKWITVHNGTDHEITVDRLTVEELAIVEHANWVEFRDGVPLPEPDALHVETDFAFGGFNPENANRHVVHWRTDPLFTTQVNWARQTPCLLVCEPTRGPAQRVAPGESFESFRVFELAQDGDRERRGLNLRRMYRTVAPWVTENPITHHLLTNDPNRVMAAIDEAAAVGFEAIILSFGSGFNMENRDRAFLARWKAVADHAEAKGIELGCYSLFSSRGVGGEHMIVSPDGERPTHGQCPAVTSAWGLQWLDTMRGFYEATGFDQFENDGPYPGDVDTTARPPLQQGELDSRWVQWDLTRDLYRDLRADGVYINAPDYYYLNGSNKCGMGYREVNWSLPRAHQVIHTRQNIYDGTWTKTPSMGWMHVPLAEYQGGGAAATIEPLREHLDHYQRMLESNLALGVQAHYRGPRLYDAPETRDRVKSVVDWFKRYRDILESDVVHGRRADGRDLDWMLHVNPALDTKGMLVVFNPLDHEVTRTLCVDLHYTGLDDSAIVAEGDADPVRHEIARDGTIEVEATVPAGGMRWFTIR